MHNHVKVHWLLSKRLFNLAQPQAVYRPTDVATLSYYTAPMFIGGNLSLRLNNTPLKLRKTTLHVHITFEISHLFEGNN